MKTLPVEAALVTPGAEVEAAPKEGAAVDPKLGAGAPKGVAAGAAGAAEAPKENEGFGGSDFPNVKVDWAAAVVLADVVALAPNEKDGAEVVAAGLAPAPNEKGDAVAEVPELAPKDGTVFDEPNEEAEVVVDDTWPKDGVLDVVLFPPENCPVPNWKRLLPV